jgi:hypothetical protein
LSIDNMLFYPRSLVVHSAPNPAVGVLASMLAVVAVVIILNRGGRHLPLALATLVGLVSVAAHPYKDPRFVFTVLPLLWLSAGWVIVRGFAAASRVVPLPGTNPVAAVTASVAMAAVALSAPIDRDLIAEGHAHRTVQTAVEPLLDDVAKRAARSIGSVLLGHWNNLSPGLVEWHCYRRLPEIRRQQVPRWLSEGKRRGDVVSRLAGDASIELLFVVGAEPGSLPDTMGFAGENRWLSPVRRALEADPRFEAADSLVYPESGYRLQVYRRSRARNPVATTTRLYPPNEIGGGG